MSATDGSREAPPAAVVGTGIMGSAMARNLLAAVLPTTVWDRSAAATTPLADAGAQVATSASEAVRHARVVITMLPTPDVVHDVIFDSGAAGQFAEGAASVQMGTVADAKLHKMESGDYAPEFPLQWALKDVDLAISAVPNATLPLLEARPRQWRATVDAGHGREDVSAARLGLTDQS